MFIKKQFIEKLLKIQLHEETVHIEMPIDLVEIDLRLGRFEANLLGPLSHLPPLSLKPSHSLLTPLENKER